MTQLARRNPAPTDLIVHTGQLLHPATAGSAGWIRHTQYMHLPHRQATLHGPFTEVRQIVGHLMARGELIRASVPEPVPAGVMVTIQFAAAEIRSGATRGRKTPRRRWSTRRRLITTTATATGAALLAVAAWQAIAWAKANPIPTALLAVLALLLLTASGRRVCKTAVTVIHRH